MYGDGGQHHDIGNMQKLKPKQMVRISNVKGLFEKNYLPNWSQKHFIVRAHKVAKQPRRKVYKIEDKGGEEVKGSFYREELQPIDENKYIIEKKIRTRNNPDTGEREHLVKWQGWPAKFNTWIPDADFEQ